MRSQLLICACASVLSTTFSSTLEAALLTPFFQDRYVEVKLDGNISEQTATDFLLFDEIVSLSIDNSPLTDDSGTATQVSEVIGNSVIATGGIEISSNGFTPQSAIADSSFRMAFHIDSPVTYSLIAGFSNNFNTGDIDSLEITLIKDNVQVIDSFSLVGGASSGVLTSGDYDLRARAFSIGQSCAFCTSSADYSVNFSVVPIPASFWLLGSGIFGLIGIARRKKS